jgi:hypothetical protein
MRSRRWEWWRAIAALVLVAAGGGASAQAARAGDMDLTTATMNGLTLLREIAAQKPERAPLRLGAGALPIRAYAARNAHPRLYLTAQVEATLRERLKRPDQHVAAYWSRLAQEATQYAQGQPPGSPPVTEDPFRGFGDTLPVLAFAYRLNHDPRFLKGAETWLRAVVGYARWSTNLGIGHCLFGVVVALDWLGDQLPPELRESARARAQSEAARFFQASHDGKEEWHFIRLQNHYWIDHTALLAAGLYFFGEFPEAETWVAYADFKLHRTDEILPPDGCDHEGFEYWEYGIEWLIRAAELRRTLLGEENVYDLPFWRNAAWYRIYAALPGWKQGVQIGDCSFTRRYGPGYQLAKLAALTGDGAMLNAGDRIETTYGGLATSIRSWQYLLSYDASTPPGDVTRKPTSHVFEDHGIYMGRSDWGDQATYLAFKAGPPLGHRATQILRRERAVDCGCAHVHPDNGALWLYRRGQGLIIPPGYVHLKASILENVLLVDGKGQLGECLMALYGTPYIEQATEPRLLRCDLTGDSDYVVGDLTPAYPPEAGLTRWRRAVFFLRPATVVVVDDLATEGARKLELQFHCAAASEVAVDASAARFTVTRGAAGLAAQALYLTPDDRARADTERQAQTLSPSGLALFERPLLIPPHLRHGDHNVTFDQKVIYLGPRGDGAAASEIGRSNGGLVVTVISLGDTAALVPAAVSARYETGRLRLAHVPGAPREIALDLPQG